MKEALKLALEALETESDIYRENDDDGAPEYILEAITALRLAIDVQNMASESTYKAALAQPAPVQEPSGFFRSEDACGDEVGPPVPYYLMPIAAQPAQEPVAWTSYEYDGIHHKPVAWMDRDGNFSDNNDHKCFPIPLYTITHPPRPWVGLTDTDLAVCNGEDDVMLARYWEAKLKEKNT
jgi:hypothetical protein